MRLPLQTSVENDLLRVSVPGPRLDAAVARDFKAGVESAWAPGLARMEIDLRAVDFVDSSGVGALLSVYRKLPASPGAMRLEGVKPGVRSMLAMLRLDQFFDIRGD
jgi:anti-sigma B factor antagonist